MVLSGQGLLVLVDPVRTTAAEAARIGGFGHRTGQGGGA